MAQSFLDKLTNRMIEYSEFTPGKVQLAIPCYDPETGKHMLAIVQSRYLANAPLYTKQAGWYFKQQAIGGIRNRLEDTLKGFDPICTLRPTIEIIKRALDAPDAAWCSSDATSTRISGSIGATMLTLIQGGMVLFNGCYSPMPKGYDYLVPPFRLTELVEFVEDSGSVFKRHHPYRRTAHSKHVYAEES